MVVKNLTHNSSNTMRHSTNSQLIPKDGAVSDISLSINYNHIYPNLSLITSTNARKSSGYIGFLTNRKSKFYNKQCTFIRR